MSAVREEVCTEWLPGRIWSLEKVLRTYAVNYLALGQRTAEVLDILWRKELDEKFPSKAHDQEERKKEDNNHVQSCLNDIEEFCDNLKLPVCKSLVISIRNRSDISREAFGVLMEAISSEIGNTKLFHISREKIRYYESDKILSETAASTFPSVHKELINSGSCYACALPTASVFHSMRAAEIGVRSLGKALGVSFPDKPIEFAE